MATSGPTSSAPALGVCLPTWPVRGGSYASWPEMRRVARDAEALGLDTIWVPDHLQRRVGRRTSGAADEGTGAADHGSRLGDRTIGFWESWTVLTAAAEATERIGIGPFVACTGFRSPALLAKMAATLDEVSGGRLVLGLGAGDPATDASWEAFGYQRDRHVTQHEEAVEIVARLLREPPLTFEGRFHRTVDADLAPRGPRPRIPVWVAARGERTMRIAARWADAVNVNVALTDAEVGASLVAQVADACRAAGRDPATLDVTGFARLALHPDGRAADRPGWLAGPPTKVATTLRAIRGTGIRHVTLYLGEADDPSPLPATTPSVLGRFEPVLTALRAG